MRRGCLVLTLLALFLWGCGGSSNSQAEQQRELEEACRASYAEGYRRGMSDVVNAIKRKAEETRQATLKTVCPKLLWGAIIASLLTLFGDAIAEAGRKHLSESFKLEPARQAELAALAFWTCAAGASIMLWSQYGPAPLTPGMLLLATAAWHLHAGYNIPALIADDKPKRSIAIGKVKTLAFLVLVVGLVFELLSKDCHLAFK